ncbi:hypothetical protein CYY_001519 [Polysphondylium violaceum]|uniref:Uncharacterized protein n=1 Tax=Polysphondylium violaceum TaxID=133409 RepID=A0A8J4PZR4_9MYCE|nr:hypothetical protein CYY_001519 [Polysphondylium violaceum]
MSNLMIIYQKLLITLLNIQGLLFDFISYYIISVQEIIDYCSQFSSLTITISILNNSNSSNTYNSLIQDTDEEDEDQLVFNHNNSPSSINRNHSREEIIDIEQLQDKSYKIN